MVTCLWVEFGNLVNEMFSQYHEYLLATSKASYISNQTLKVIMASYGDKSQKVMSSGKQRSNEVIAFLLATAQFPNLLQIRNTSSSLED